MIFFVLGTRWGPFNGNHRGNPGKTTMEGGDVVGISRTCVKIGIIGIACIGLTIGCATKSADINGDGFPDTVQLRSLDVEPGIYVVLSEGKNPDGSIKYAKPKRIVCSNIISDIKLFDYNSDGNQDIIYRTALAGSPSNYVLLGNGNGTFKEPLELGKEFDFFKARDGGG
jgi:hypothetical protein